MSTVPAPFPRHALGWPAGSIRAILAFGVLGYLWILARTSQITPELRAELIAKLQAKGYNTNALIWTPQA